MWIRLLLALFGTQAFLRAQPEEGASVLLVVLDDVGAEDFAEVELPALDSIAARGLSFQRGYSMPICAPARHALMFGRYGESSGAVCQPPDERTPYSTWPSLPRLFKGLGHQTGFFGKWHLGTNREGKPWELTPVLHGFDSVLAGAPENLAANKCGEGFDGHYSRWLRFEDGRSFVDTQYHTSAVRDAFLRWWPTTRGPKFAYVAFQAAHSPFHEPPPELQPHQPVGGDGYSRYRIKFEKMLIAADAALGAMLAVVDPERTYLIVVGDNGTPPNARSPHQPRDRYKGTAYEGGIRVPFLVAGPGVPKGATSDALVSVVDWLPTLAERFGTRVDVPDGVSFAPVLTDPSARVRDHVFASASTERGIVQERFKLVRRGDVEEFYDVRADPHEQAPLDPATLPAALLADLRGLMSGYLSRGF